MLAEKRCKGTAPGRPAFSAATASPPTTPPHTHPPSVPLPDTVARSALLSRALDTAIAAHGSHGANMSQREFQTLVKKTDGFSGADLASLCQEAAMGPVRELGARIATASADELRPIILRDFESALRAVRPSVDPASLSKYVEWNAQFGST